MFVTERFKLDEDFKKALRRKSASFGFDGFGEVIYYRTYSRRKESGGREAWADTVMRVVEGTLSIRKQHYRNSGLAWDDERWQNFAQRMAASCFEMHWLPPGRGLWAMGTEFVYERGSAALYNCGAVDTIDLVAAADWAMDMLMLGVGVGFNTAWSGRAVMPDKRSPETFLVPDSREGWVASLRKMLAAYCDDGPWVRFDYRLIRPAGTPIRGFGGTASGPKPLQELHERVEKTMDAYCLGEIDKTRCVVDIFNAIGVCVVAGNVRRSAEIALGSADDETFLHLKDYRRFPDRRSIGWVSNNSVLLRDVDDYDRIPEIASLVRRNGEPGFLNLTNIQRYGRFADPVPDKAWLTNPCGEIALEGYELCNLAEIFPTRCLDEKSYWDAVAFATFYAVTVSLLPTHRPETNAIVERNRRTGVSISGIADWIERRGLPYVQTKLSRTYDTVRRLNEKLAKESGIPASLKVTAIKPSGTVSLLAGTSPGMHYPPARYAIRRLRVGEEQPIARFLIETGVPYKRDIYGEKTLVFEFPIHYENRRTIHEVNAWEQLSLLATLQRTWADNMVSNTIVFDQGIEEKEIARMLDYFLPVVKSVAMMPSGQREAYRQMPIEPISKERYEALRHNMPSIDWSAFVEGEGAGAPGCGCEE